MKSKLDQAQRKIASGLGVAPSPLSLFLSLLIFFFMSVLVLPFALVAVCSLDWRSDVMRCDRTAAASASAWASCPMLRLPLSLPPSVWFSNIVSATPSSLFSLPPPTHCCHSHSPDNHNSVSFMQRVGSTSSTPNWSWSWCDFWVSDSSQLRRTLRRGVRRGCCTGVPCPLGSAFA